MLGHLCGKQPSIQGRDRRALQTRQHPRSTEVPQIRQRPEFVSRAILKWLTEANIDTAYIDPGKPWLNGMNESFNGKIRDECLNMQWCKNRIDAKILIEDFRRQLNEIRPHSALGNLTSAEFKHRLSTTNADQAISQA
jgi:putative transposase